MAQRGTLPTAWTVAVMALGFSGVGLTLMGQNHPEFWRIMMMMLLLLAGSVPVLVVLRRHGAGPLLKSMIIQCPRCDYLRIGDRDDEETVDAFRRGRALFDSLRIRLWAVTAFFALLYLGGWILVKPVSPAVGGILIIAGGAALTAAGYGNAWRPSRWWRRKPATSAAPHK